MTSDTLKQALHSHAWVGLIISLPLFIVFWAGAITLFLPEVETWSKAPYYSVEQAVTNDIDLRINERIEKHTAAYGKLPEDSVFVSLPTDKSPYLEIAFEAPIDPEAASLALTAFEQAKAEAKRVEGESNETVPTAPTIEKEWKALIIDPHTGEVYTEHSPFELAHFLNALHITLHLPQGVYIVGFITFFFFVIIITGIIVQLKNLAKNFFLYRHDKNRKSQMNDLHNVVGVISLPYAIMFAVTGVILNLSLLFIIPTSFTLYSGDQEGLMQDAGFAGYQPKPVANSPADMPNLQRLVKSTTQEFGATITGLTLHHYGDAAAAVHLRGQYHEGFTEAFDAVYEIQLGEFVTTPAPNDNIFSSTLTKAFSLHFGNFAGTDLRILYFVLAMAFCGMIVAGNVLFLEKRTKRNQYPKTLAVTRATTLGACLGIMTATAFAFLLERAVPEAFYEREHMIEYAFGLVFLIIVMWGFFANNVMRFIRTNLYACAGLLFVMLAFEWVVFGTPLIAMGRPTPLVFYVSIGIFLCAAALFWAARQTLERTTKQRTETQSSTLSQRTS